MTEKTTRAGNRSFQSPSDSKSIASLLGGSPVKHGSSVSLTLSEGAVNVTLDRLGDWTITVGLSARSGRTLGIVESLERLGFFHAAESEGVVYLLWTSALQGFSDARRLVEETLFEALKALQCSSVSRYIC